MKKITLLAALLGTTYFANAQVGIGTADPATSAELEIVAKAGDKGIIIPRVALTAENIFAPIKGAQVESLLVYNSTQSTAMPKGFYYWDGAKWNRIIGKTELDTELDTVVENLGNDITNIQNVINYILPSNPDNTDTTKPGHTTIVYDNTKGDMYEVVYDATTKKYITKKIDLLKMIQGKETNTFFREIKDGNGKITGHIYFNESTIVKAIGTETDAAKIKIILDGLDAKTPGAISIDVKGTVVNNIQEILKSTTEIKEGDKTFTTTVEQYLQYITQFSEGNVIYKNISTDPAKPNWVLQYWDNTANEYKTINLTDLVAAVETKTDILRTESKANGKLEAYAAAKAPVEANVKKGEIFYKYNNEDKGEQFINMTADIISSINNNEEVKNALTNILNQGGNVYFGDHDNDAATDNVFYTMKIVNGKEEKTPIKLPASFILDIINNYKDVIKQALGDNITNEGDIVFTGNIYNGRQVLLAKGSTKANGSSARTEGVTLANATGDNAINGVLSIKVLKAGVVVTESTKDVVVAGTKIDFNIGVGNIYTALPADTYEVVVEYLGKEVK
ncbi:hypothetical protein HX045_08185 [Myroides odoratimimus]|uniref:hypothetical protein n=1 Tax=Myroides odoratimimus TaxID=76832 RepID=UPI0025750969|nr:hypothetical protein [Myroides odoratimimus]MDM1483666.1 hypothetical protein [Myroides odoratimimus]